MDGSKKTTGKLSRIIGLDRGGGAGGVYTEEYFWRLILPLIHTCYTSSILSCTLKKIVRWIFRFFSNSCGGGLIQISFD